METDNFDPFEDSEEASCSINAADEFTCNRNRLRDARRAKVLAQSSHSIADRRFLFLTDKDARAKVCRIPSAFTAQECDHVLELVRVAAATAQQDVNGVGVVAAAAAAANRPTGTSRMRKDGWQRMRHSSHATVDMPVTEEQFGREGSATILSLVQSRILPHLTAHIGLAETGDLIFRDLFVVRYVCDKDYTPPNHVGDPSMLNIASQSSSAQTNSSSSSPSSSTSPSIQSQRGLGLHGDGCLISFNLLLNPSHCFQGGGTYFAHTDETIYLDQGSAVYHSGSLLHKGVDITHGERILLVGFVDTRAESMPLR